MASPNTQLTPETWQQDPQTGLISVAGMPLAQLAKQYGTPLYLLDQQTIESMAAAYRDTLQTHYPEASLALYAGKANLSLGLCKLIARCGLGLDVVSGGELYTALNSDFPRERIFFNGNFKSKDELIYAVSEGIGRITVDNLLELDTLAEIASTQHKRVPILLRVTPGIECHTHDYIKTGHLDSKFGFDPQQLPSILERIFTQYQHCLDLTGLHAHVGSQIFEVQPYLDLIEVLFETYVQVREQYQQTFSDLNIGGGLGIRYQESDDPPDIATTLTQLSEAVQKTARLKNYPLPRLLLEPGRSLIATAGITLYEVGPEKAIPGGRTYWTVNGGMGDNIRPALYQALYTAKVDGKLDTAETETVTVAGKYCESGDVLLRDVTLPKLQTGDLLVVLATGAYNYTMSSNYNRFPRPAMVLLHNQKAALLVNREQLSDLIRQDQIPEHLRTP